MIALSLLAALLALPDPAEAGAPASQVAAAPAASLLAWHGDWVGEGTAFGQKATATLTLEPVFAGGATRLDYRLAVDGAPPIRYFAQGLYRVDGRGRITGSWSDSGGQNRPVAGRIDANIWAVHWGSADSEIGRSTYVLGPDGSLSVSDSVLQQDGVWRVFATLTYQRNQ